MVTDETEFEIKRLPKGGFRATVHMFRGLRFEAAKSAAPYIQPRLAHIESKNETTLTKIVSPEPTTTEWEEEFTEQRPN